MLFFISFMILGIYLLLNILLASVFSKFTRRLEERITVNKMKRKKQVTQVYEKFEASSNKHLNPEEFRNFIAFVYDLQILSRVGRNQYVRILKKLGLSIDDDVPKDTIIDFLVS